jgi:integrase
MTANKQKMQIKIEGDVKDELTNKIDYITQYNSKPYFKSALLKLSRANPENGSIICDYILAEQTQMNIKESTKEGKIKVLTWLSNHFHNKKSFRDTTKQDILEYLNGLRKPLSEDPTRKWIGSYNSRQMIFNKFFRWLYSPDEPETARRMTPPCMTGIRKLPHQEKSPYRPSNLWNAREHATFLKYCPSKRDRCYHAMANDMSARPHELLNLKIKDIVFKLTEEGSQYAEVLITGGKTKPRTLPLIDSIPYVKEWIQDHPTGTNTESWLFVSLGNNTYGSRFTYDGLYGHYKYHYQGQYFPSLLDDSTVPEADKAYIRNMLTKPWNLYIFRHSALTEKSQILKESVLRDHAGWTMNSQMPQIYIHYFGTESSRSLLEAKGVIKQEGGPDYILKNKQCPNCSEPNKPDFKFCAKCRMVLSYDAYNETLQLQDKQKMDMDKISKVLEEIDEVKRHLGLH